METSTEQIKKSLQQSILICKKQIDSLFNRFQNNKIDKQKYYTDIEKWDNRLYKYQKELECIK